MIPPRRELLYTSKATIFATFTQGTPPELLVWRPAGIMIAEPKDYICLYTLKATV